MKKIIILLLFTIVNYCTAQNLLLNPSFEEFSNCPNNFNQISYANNWSAGCEYGNHDEYFNCCTLNDPNIDPFLVLFWTHALTTIKPKTGCGEAGILTYYTSTAGATASNYREAITGKLGSNLVSNKCYFVVFNIRFFGYHSNWFINNRNVLNYATNRISALISPDSTIYPTVGFTDLFQLHPQINYHGPVLNDTNTWVKVEGSFVAQGNEQWIHITSFVPDDSVTVYLHPSLTSYIDSSNICSYYLIDDVAVYPCDAPVYVAYAGIDTCVRPGNSITIGSPQKDEYLYWWYDEQGNLLKTTAQITVNPTQTTTYYLVQKDFKFDETRDSVTVTVGNCPLPDYSNLDFEIYPNPCNDIVNIRFNTKIPEGAVLKLYDMIGQEVAQYPLTGANNIATVHLGNFATAVYHAMVVVPDIMRKSVKLVVMH